MLIIGCNDQAECSKHRLYTYLGLKNRIWRLLNRLAYPVFDCEDCIGMAQYGCYCAAMDASAPGQPPTLLQRMALWIVKTHAP